MVDVFRAKEKAKSLLKGVEGINGIGIAWTQNGQPCLRINVRESIAEENRQKIPLSIDAVPVQIRTLRSIALEPLEGTG